MRTTYAQYGWIVTRDLDYQRDPADSDRLGIPSRVDSVGPRDIHPEVEKALRHKGPGRRGKKWRTRYDRDPDMTVGDTLVHQGWLVTLADLGLATEDEIDPDVEFGPLHDLSQPDCGAAEIQYYERNPDNRRSWEWRTL